ncbi:hypothetical protein IWQ61_002449 [Dispira simplex]|nr:hypothetical protein IWQ61_002449 [Dispira simplex]
MDTLGMSKVAVGGMMAGQMYRNYEAPRYLTSHWANTACMLLCCTATLVLKTVFRVNKRIEHSLDRAESDPTL